MPFGQAALKFCLPWASLRMRFFGVIWIRISDPRSVWIMVYQRNWGIHDQSGFINSIDAPDSHRFWITDQITPKEPTRSLHFSISLRMTCMISCPLGKWEWKFYSPGAGPRKLNSTFFKPWFLYIIQNDRITLNTEKVNFWAIFTSQLFSVYNFSRITFGCEQINTRKVLGQNCNIHLQVPLLRKPTVKYCHYHHHRSQLLKSL